MNATTLSAAARDLTLVGGVHGSVVHVVFTVEPRPTIQRIVVFLSTGQTIVSNPANPSGRRELRITGGGARERQVDLATTGTLITQPAELVGKPLAGSRVPVGISVAITGVSQDPWTTEGHSAGAVGFTGAICIGSIVWNEVGAGWATISGTTDATEGHRLMGVFHDGSGIFAETGWNSPDPAVTLLRGQSDRPGAVHHFDVAANPRGRLDYLTCAATGPLPSDVTGKPRDEEQHVAFVSSRDDDFIAWTYAPVDLVRSGVTGVGLLEGRTPVASDQAEAAEPSLPDPW